MGKSLNFKNLLAPLVGAGLFAVMAVGSASAQSASNGQLMGGGLIEKLNAAGVSSMFGDLAITTAAVDDGANETYTMMATTNGGASFIVSLMLCDDLANGIGCKKALIYTALSNAGVAYDDLNTFNINSEVTRAINISTQSIVVFGTQIFPGGGISQDNFKLLSQLFLLDMQRYVDGRNASAATVSMLIAPAQSGKVDNLGAERSIVTRQAPMMPASYIEHAVSAAVSNTLKVEFLQGEIVSLMD